MNRNSIRSAGLLLALLLAAASCAPRAAQSTQTTETRQTTETAQSPQIIQSTEATSTALKTPEPTPLLLAISIHVEGYAQEAKNFDLFQIHRRDVLQVAEAAEVNGAVLTFELSAVFVEALTQWDDDFIEVVTSMGHSIGVHADIGGSDPPLDVFIAKLTTMKADLEALGGQAIHVSGICSGSPWVEAAIEAGFTATTGSVEYCLKSLDTDLLEPSKQSAAACQSPSACHGPAIDDLEQKMTPWLTSSSSTWTIPDPQGEFLIIAGESGSSVSCLAEAQSGQGCSLDAKDIAVFTATIEQYLAAHDGQGIAALTYSWSIGTRVDDQIAEALFEAIALYSDSSEIAWVGVPEIVRLFEASVTNATS